MMTPATLNDSTVASEILSELAAAIALPADGIVYERGQVRMTHRPATRIKVEQVLVSKYGLTFRRRLVKGRWQDVETISEGI